MKRWLLERFLPMWAKETLWKDHRALRRENHRLRRQILQKDAYIKGIHRGLRMNGQWTIDNGQLRYFAKQND